MNRNCQPYKNLYKITTIKSDIHYELRRLYKKLSKNNLQLLREIDENVAAYYHLEQRLVEIKM